MYCSWRYTKRIDCSLYYRANKVVIRALQKLTSLNIFPVLVQPAKFRLLMHRIEAYEQHRHDLDWPYYVHWYFTHSIVEYVLAEQVVHKQQIVEEPWEYE